MRKGKIKTLSVTMLLFISCMCYSQSSGLVEIDSAYYDSKWRGVPDKAFASYLRVYSTPVDQKYKKQYRDYYTTGEVKGEGFYISIDPMDGTKSVLDGEQVSYYKSGAVESKENWVDGKINGEKQVYLENGLIYKNMYYKDGKLDGTYTEFFDDNGYVQTEYRNGEYANPYYTRFDPLGRGVKYSFDGTPIFETPTDDMCKDVTLNGFPWQYYDINGILIGCCAGTYNKYGKYYKVILTIINNTLPSVEFEPEITDAIAVTSKNDTIQLETLSADDYLASIKRQMNILSAIAGVTVASASISSAISGVPTPTSTSTTDINATVNGVTTTAKVTTSVYDYNQTYRNSVIMGKQISAMESGFQAQSEEAYEGYLKKNNLGMGDSMSGYILFKYKKGEEFIPTFKINGVPYKFHFKTGK